MNIESYRAFCLSLPGSAERLPFGPEAFLREWTHHSYDLVVFNLSKKDRKAQERLYGNA